MNAPRDYSDHDPDNDFWHDDRQARSHRRGLITIWVMGILGALIFAYATMADADAHTAPSGMKYDAWCCNSVTANSGDCQPVPDSAVRVISGGYQVTLGPGQHRLVTRVHVWQKAQTEVRYSTDGQYHVCLFPNEDTLRCLYVPPVSG